MVESLDNCVPQSFLVTLIWSTALLTGRLNLEVRLYCAVLRVHGILPGGGSSGHLLLRAEIVFVLFFAAIMDENVSRDPLKIGNLYR